MKILNGNKTVTVRLQKMPRIFLERYGAFFADMMIFCNVSADFRTSAENVKTFYDNYVNTWGSLLDMLGAPNSAPNKHERLLTNELEMNQSLARYISGDRLKARRDFISEVNEKFGTNYRVNNYLEMLITEESNYGMESDDIDNDVQPMGGNAGHESVERPRG